MNEALAELMRGFAAKLPPRLVELDVALEGARTGDATAREDARRLAHKLHGTAGSYGYKQVSSAAGKLEALLTAGEFNWAELDEAHRALRHAVETAANTA